MTKTAPTVAAAAVAAIMAADSMTRILSPGRGTRPRGFRVPLTDPTVCMVRCFYTTRPAKRAGIII